MTQILSNGIRLLTDYVNSVETVCIGVFIKCGSKYELPQHNGLAHLIEHLIFRDNQKYKSREIKEFFDNIGSKINAITTKEYICIYVKIINEYLNETITILSDLIKFPAFDENDIFLEKKIILNEINQYNDNHFERVQKNLIKETFGDHQLALDILGTPESLSRISKEQIIDYYNKYFVADNIVISISGKFNQDIYDVVEKNFSSIKSSNERSILPEVTYRSEVIIEKAKISQNYLAIGIPAYSALDSKLIPLLIFNNILGHGFSSILYKKLREERALVYSIHSYALSYTEGGLLIITASTSQNNLNELLKETIDIIDNMGKCGINKMDLQKGITNLISYILFGMENIQSRMFEQGKSALINSKNNSINLNNLVETIEQLKRYKVDEINEVIEELCKNKKSISIITSLNNHEKLYI